MHWLHRIIVAFSLFFLLGFLVTGYFLLTTSGSNRIIRYLLSAHGESENVFFKTVKGNLMQGLSYEEIRVLNVRGLPPESVLTIQEFQVAFHSLNRRDVEIGIHNGKFLFPHAEYPILFGGSYRNRMLDVNIYSKGVEVRDILDLFSEEGILRYFAGTIGDIDAYIKGSLGSPEVSGAFVLKQFSFKEFNVMECPVSFKLRFEDMGERLKVYGEVQFHSGDLISRNAKVELAESSFFFAGDPENPTLHLAGRSKIQDIHMDISLQGTFENPELNLGSDPPLPQEELLLTLATGRRWRGMETNLSQGQIPLDLAKDFLDYFTSAGGGNSIARRFGLEGVSLTYDAQTGGVGVQKSVAGKAELRYQVERQEAELMREQPVMTQKLGAEYKVTDSISINAEQETQRQEVETSLVKEEPRRDSKVWLKYKKKF